MRRLVLVIASVLSVGCSANNGDMDATMVLKCYQDTTIDGASVRQVYKEFTYDFSSSSSSGRALGLLNTDAELQVSAIFDCEENCVIECGLPPGADETDVAPEIIQLDRIVVSGVIGRIDEFGVQEEDLALYSPAGYLSQIGPKVVDGGAERCMSSDEYTDHMTTLYGLSAAGGGAPDPEAFSFVQVNNVLTGLFSWADSSDNGPIMAYETGVSPSTMDDGCLSLPWANLTIDQTTELYKGDDITGTMQVYNHDLPSLGLLVDVYGTSGPGTGAAFSIKNLPRNDVDIETVVTENNEPGELGL